MEGRVGKQEGAEGGRAEVGDEGEKVREKENNAHVYTCPCTAVFTYKCGSSLAHHHLSQCHLLWTAVWFGAG